MSTETPCCVPSKERADRLAESRWCSEARPCTTKGSKEGMVLLEGGQFLMGTESDAAFTADGEGPVRRVTIDPFYIDVHPITNRQFSEFVGKSGYRTEAGRFGWSFVFHKQLPREKYGQLVDDTVAGHEWWCKVSGADWRHPEGPDSDVGERDGLPRNACLVEGCRSLLQMGGQAPADRGGVGVRRSGRAGAAHVSLGR